MENELIGKVRLNYDHYSGEDLYCDGAVEDQILNIVKNYSKVEYPKIIEANKSWPIFYHLSTQRENIVRWLPINRDMKVLEIGSGCGAVTGALSKRAGRVDCVDLSRKRSLINAYRHEEDDNITIHVGNFKDIEPDLDRGYDLVLLIGVFEYAQSYIGGDTPFEDFLDIVRSHVGENGRLAIAIENRYGLKYFAGCREDHLGTFFSSIEMYKDGGGVRTFSKAGFEKMFGKAGIEDYHFYYPYPDYKFMTTLFSDDRLPGKGELCNNYRNFDRDRLLLFDETTAWDGIVESGEFPFFSNSYMILIGSDADIDYVRYSNDRSDEYAIGTLISSDHVDKVALCEECNAHVEDMVRHYKALEERYRGGRLKIAPCEKISDGVVRFPIVKGRPLSELFDEYLLAGDIEGFKKLFSEYIDRTGYGSGSDITDMDLVFSNILVDGDEWTAIDYEWVRERSVPVKETAYRALYCYTLESEYRNSFDYSEVISLLALTNDELEGFREDEAIFQKKVTGKRMSMGELRDSIGGAMITMDQLLTGQEKDSIRKKVQIYTDTGRGFNEDDSYFVDALYDSNGYIDFHTSLESGTVNVRIDPCMEYCMTEILEISLNGELLDLKDNKRVYVNGKKVTNGNSVTAVFYYDDPNIVVKTKDIIRSTGNRLRVRMITRNCTESMIRSLQNELGKLIRL
ncbi:MAG: class I SAM-dependent methyltransferase [Lachnospiraceae bacterium]|nr:class I SAM-dependent methyltransferase [Lachnospiraceae bacterium]